MRPGDNMTEKEHPLFTALWDAGQAETQLAAIIRQLDELRPQLPEKWDTKTLLLSDNLHAVLHRLVSLKYHLTALLHRAQ